MGTKIARRKGGEAGRLAGERGEGGLKSEEVACRLGCKCTGLAVWWFLIALAVRGFPGWNHPIR